MKCVTFNNVICMHVIDLEYDSVTYQNARSGQEWINCAIDRSRFRQRINNCEDALEKVFKPHHRSKMLKMNMLK